MADKRAIALAQRLVRRFGNRDPFRIADSLGITVIFRDDFKQLKGAFVVVGNNSFVFINSNLTEHMQRLVCAHELGHAVLDRKLGLSPGGLTEFEIFDITNDTEYDANVFAATLLIDDADILEMAEQEYDVVQMARTLGLNANVLLVKMIEMNKRGYQFQIPYTPDKRFLGKIPDNAGLR